jgi:hypothetical protein
VNGQQQRGQAMDQDNQQQGPPFRRQVRYR